MLHCFFHRFVCMIYGRISSILATMRCCSSSGGSGIKNCSKLFAARLGCAVPLSYKRICEKNSGASKYCIKYSDKISSSAYCLQITNDEAIAPTSNGYFPCFPKDDNLLCLSKEQYDKLGNGKLIKGDVVVCIRQKQ